MIQYVHYLSCYAEISPLDLHNSRFGAMSSQSLNAFKTSKHLDISFLVYPVVAGPSAAPIKWLGEVIIQMCPTQSHFSVKKSPTLAMPKSMLIITSKIARKIFKYNLCG